MPETIPTANNLSACLVRFQETHCQLSEADQNCVNAIYAVYLYDRNAVTHCCEITPSYELTFLYYDVEYTLEFYVALSYEDGEGDAHDYRDSFEKSLNDFSGGISYMHCHVVDSQRERGEQWHREAHDPSMFPDGDTYEEVFERIREHYVCNIRL